MDRLELRLLTVLHLPHWLECSLFPVLWIFLRIETTKRFVVTYIGTFIVSDQGTGFIEGPLPYIAKFNCYASVRGQLVESGDRGPFIGYQRRRRRTYTALPLHDGCINEHPAARHGERQQ